MTFGERFDFASEGQIQPLIDVPLLIVEPIEIGICGQGGRKLPKIRVRNMGSLDRLRARLELPAEIVGGLIDDHRIRQGAGAS